jgi:hypothetical protein
MSRRTTQALIPPRRWASTIASRIYGVSIYPDSSLIHIVAGSAFGIF